MSRQAKHSVAATIQQRGKTYGSFALNAAKAQQLKENIRDSVQWENMTDVQKEAAEAIVIKLARILTGDPNHADSWHDIAGYASLAEQSI